MSSPHFLTSVVCSNLIVSFSNCSLYSLPTISMRSPPWIDGDWRHHRSAVERERERENGVNVQCTEKKLGERKAMFFARHKFLDLFCNLPSPCLLPQFFPLLLILKLSVHSLSPAPNSNTSVAFSCPRSILLPLGPPFCLRRWVCVEFELFNLWSLEDFCVISPKVISFGGPRIFIVSSDTNFCFNYVLRVLCDFGLRI